MTKCGYFPKFSGNCFTKYLRSISMVFTLLFPDFYPECRAILPGFRPDSGVVCLADALRNRQPQPGSAAGVGWVRAVKALKNMGQPVRWDGRAGVVHRQNRLAARCGQPQGHGAAGARVLDGIIQQDHRQPMQGGGIPLHGLAGGSPATIRIFTGKSPSAFFNL